MLLWRKMPARKSGVWDGLTAWVIWRFYMPGTDSGIRALLVAMALIWIGVGVRGWYEKGFKHNRSLVFFLTGLALSLGAIFWTRLGSVIGDRLMKSAESAANDFRYWFALLLVGATYGAALSIISTLQRDKYSEIIELDINPFRLALQRWVLPRHLNEEQVAIIGQHLAKFLPHTIHIAVCKDDAEANGYAGNFQNALRQGGWTVMSTSYADNLQEGTQAHLQHPLGAGQNPRAPRPDTIFAEALKLAGVALDGGVSAGSGAGDTETVFTLRIGKRRRDQFAAAQKWI